MSLVRELEALELEALARAASPSWHTIRIDVRSPCKGPAKSLPTVESWWWKRRFDGTVQCRRSGLGGKGEAVRLGSLHRGVWIPYLGPNSPTSINTRGCLVGVKQTDLRAPTLLQHLTFPRRHCAVCCVLQYVIWEIAQWISCIIPRNPRFMGWKNADLTQRKHLDAPGLPPTPHFHPVPWQLMQRGFGLHCVEIEDEAWWEQWPPFYLSVPVFLSLIREYRYSKCWGQTVCPSMGLPRLRFHGGAMVGLAKIQRW